MWRQGLCFVLLGGCQWLLGYCSCCIWAGRPLLGYGGTLFPVHSLRTYEVFNEATVGLYWMDGLLLLSRGFLYVYVYAYVNMLIRVESSQRRSKLCFLQVVEVFLMLYKPPSIFQYHHSTQQSTFVWV